MTSSYTVLTGVQRRSHYVTLTDRLISVLEGGSGWRPDEVVYLDKSGRPVAWLVRALWPVLAREPGTEYSAGVVPPRPGTRMVNIDREQWWELTGGTESGLVDVARVPQESVAALRAVFLRRQPRAGEPVWEIPAWLDGVRILVVDEVSNSGDTLRIATGLISRAFPTSEVKGDHWMTPGTVTDRRGFSRVQDVPVWYQSSTWTGRLVGNRLDARNPPATWRGERGAMFLSTRPRLPDASGRRLRSEAALLARDVSDGRLLAVPSGLRDDAVERIRALYGYQDPREFTAARIAQAGP